LHPKMIKEMKKLFVLYLFFHSSLVFSQISKIGYVDVGKASYYFNDRNGAITRSGEIFDMNSMEAAHRDIAFGSIVKVTNLDNGKVAFLRINDRPYTTERILDTTKAAAIALGMFDVVAVAEVKVEIVAAGVSRNTNGKYENYQNAAPANALEESKNSVSFAPVNTYTVEGKVVSPKGFGVQVGGFLESERAIEEVQNFAKQTTEKIYVQAGWQNGQKFYRVLVGAFATKEAAQKLAQKLSKADFKPFVKEHFE